MSIVEASRLSDEDVASEASTCPQHDAAAYATVAMYDTPANRHYQCFMRADATEEQAEQMLRCLSHHFKNVSVVRTSFPAERYSIRVEF